MSDPTGFDFRRHGPSEPGDGHAEPKRTPRAATAADWQLDGFDHSAPNNTSGPLTDELTSAGRPSFEPFGKVVVAVHPPMRWLGTALIVAVVGVALGIIHLGSVGGYVAGWALGGPVAICLLAVFARIDARRQTEVFYSYSPWKTWTYRLALFLGLVAVVLNALRFADWVGRR